MCVLLCDVQIAKWTFDLANELEQFVIAELGDVIEFTRHTEVCMRAHPYPPQVCDSLSWNS